VRVESEESRTDLSIFASASVSLEQIRRPIERELDQFDAVFRRALKSKIGLVDIVTRYIIRQKGKRVRPMLVLLSAKACGPVSDRSFRGAGLVELLHTATLVHDDVVDDADTRRGFASINAVWKNKVAVLLGDYLLSRGLLLALEQHDVDFLNLTSIAVKRMSEGELLQIQKTRQLDLTEETYLQIIGDKTASLFATCTEIGAASATDSASLHQALRSYGENLGLAFQIRDDLLDYLGKKSIIGKPTGIDIKEKKLTLPLIHALRNGSRKDARQALRTIKDGAKEKQIEWVMKFVKEEGGIEYASERALTFAALARTNIELLPPSSSKESLLGFIRFVTEREK